MLLSQIHVAGPSGLDRLTLRLDDASGAPRRLVVLFGGDGVGKTSLLAAIATTRPGHAVAQGSTPSGAPDAFPPYASADWLLGDDDPTRPHPLRVVSPNAKLPDERDEATALRRREQGIFDRRAADGGFALVSFSGARWFSRAPVLLTSPERTVLRHDARIAASFDDATRADLTRDTKQILAYAAAASALARARGAHAATELTARRLHALDRALNDALAAVLEGTGASYLGASESTLEPLFALGHREVELDELPRAVRHRVAFVALTVRALAAAYPARDPRDAEGVVLLDDLEAQQPEGRVLAALPERLRAALPRVQWIVTTASRDVAAACDEGEVVALRRLPGSALVEVHQGPMAMVH